MKYFNWRHEKIDDTAAALKLKQEQELAKVKVKDKPKKSAGKVSGFGFVSLTDQAVLMDNLGTMLKAGLAITPALKAITQEIKNGYLRKVLNYLVDHVENGQPLSEGMKKFPRIFPEMVIATIEVGENTGNLSESLTHLADILKAQKKLRSKVLGALIYPIVVLLILVAVSLLLALFVFPQLVTVFEEAGVELPVILTVVNWLNFAIRNFGWYILGGLVCFILILRMIFAFSGPRYAWHLLTLRLPIAGAIIKNLNLARFSGNLFALLSAGLSIVKAMNITAHTLGNMKFRKAVFEMAIELEKGVSLDEAMRKREDLFPSLTVQLCNVGETTGELESVLKKIAEYYEEKVSATLTNLSTVLEPALLVLVGIAVGFIAVSVISPIYELTLSFAE